MQKNINKYRLTVFVCMPGSDAVNTTLFTKKNAKWIHLNFTGHQKKA